MDELLHANEGGEALLSSTPSGVLREPSLGTRLRRMTDAVLDRAELARRRLSRLFHRVDGMTAGHKFWGPAAFLAAAGILGVALVVGTVYTPSYVVSVDGVPLGTVREQRIFEAAVERVERRTSAILGYDFTLDREISYEFALTERDDLSPVSGFETYLFDQIGEVMKTYVLTVNGQFIGAVTDRAQLDGMLEGIKSAYCTEDTVSAEFVEGVQISYEYTAADIMQDLSQMEAILTENTNGETTYEVKRGDTFMAIAYANDMSVDELMELNPQTNINKLYVGDILTVRETIPFLSVRTVNAVTYTEAIASPVEEVKDDSMYQGERRTVVKGTAGEALVTADVTCINGREKERTVTSSTVLTEPTTTVVHVGTKPRPRTMATGSFIWPLASSRKVTSGYGSRYIFGSYSFHSGIDIAGSYGAKIRAADGGKVVFAGKGTGGSWSYGNYVVIDHENGLQTIYAHCSSLAVSTGERVYQGQTIAYVGDTGRTTGYHLHFQVKVNGTTVNPWNYLSR